MAGCHGHPLGGYAVLVVGAPALADAVGESADEQQACGDEGGACQPPWTPRAIAREWQRTALRRAARHPVAGNPAALPPPRTGAPQARPVPGTVEHAQDDDRETGMTPQTPPRAATDLDDTAERHLARAIELGRQARTEGNGSFGAVLVAADGTVLAEGRNTVRTTGDITAHAESAALRSTGTAQGLSAVAGSTMYASGEPCPMCSTAMYLAGVERVIYGFAAADMRRLGAADDAYIALSCREVLAHGSRPVKVTGPVHDGAEAAFAGE
jgi:tRNA(adenine34) deaminase